MSLDKILKECGLMSVQEYEELMDSQSFISTGYQEIDEIIGENAGFPRGCLSEVFGASRVGKSRFVRDICLRPENHSLYIDTENALSAKEFHFLKDHGVDVVAENLLDSIWPLVNSCLDEDLYDVIVVDSIGATDTQAERDENNTLSMSTSLQRAKIMSSWLRGLPAHILGKKAALIFVNHAKPAVGSVVHQMSKPCGKSIDFHCMVQLQFSGGDSTIRGTLKDLDVSCVKTRYGIVKKKVKVKIDLDPYKEIQNV